MVCQLGAGEFGPSLGIELQYRIDRHQEGRDWQSLPAKTLLLLPILVMCEAQVFGLQAGLSFPFFEIFSVRAKVQQILLEYKLHEMNQIKYEHIYILQVINSFCYFQDTINIIIGNNHCICHQLNKIHYIRGVQLYMNSFF